MSRSAVQSVRGWGGASAARAPSALAAPSDLRIGMPHLNAGGLSESWLFRHAGDQHWQGLGARWGVGTGDFKSESGERLYPTFIAVRATYDAPLSTIEEDHRADTRAALSWVARGYGHGFVTVKVGETRLRLEMLTMLAARSTSGQLRATRPSPRACRTVSTLTDDSVPGLVALAKSARNHAQHEDPFAGEALGRDFAPLETVRYEPSPYSDFNGAGLLYFASFVSIADTAERQIACRLGWLRTGDWALATSTLRRDVFYYGNIRLGQAVATHLLAVEWGRGTVKTHLRMVREADGHPLADLITEKVVRRADA